MVGLLEPPHARLGGNEPQRAVEILLSGYVAGTLNPCLHALAESHLILSDENREFVRTLEAKAGDDIETLEPHHPFSRAARDQVLAAIYAGGWYGRPRPRKNDPDLPEPIDRLVGAPLDALPWRFLAFGLREHRIHDADGVHASLYRVKPGGRLPAHTHRGLEATLVLKGGFSDQAGHYQRGDVALANDSVDHRPVADFGEPCVCFAVTEAPPRLTGPLGRLIQKAFGG